MHTVHSLIKIKCSYKTYESVRNLRLSQTLVKIQVFWDVTAVSTGKLLPMCLE